MSSPESKNPPVRPSQPGVLRPILKKDMPETPASSDMSSGASVGESLPGAQVYRPVIKKREAAPNEISVRTDTPTEASTEEEVTEKIIKKSPPWMASAIFHIVILLILALWLLPGMLRSEPELEIVVVIDEDVFMEDLGIQTEIEMGADESEEMDDTDMAFDDNPVPDPLLANIEVPVIAEAATTESVVIAEAALGKRHLDGRNPGGRAGLCGRYGGTKTTEDAVNLALRWLSRQQMRDGSWSLKGPYADGADGNENQEAATAMAILAFQGAGHTHKDGEFKGNVARGWTWLLKQQDPRTGNFYTDGHSEHSFYTQGQCTIAVCELYAMTKDKRFLEPAKKAVAYIIESQSPQGGWRYRPNDDSDTSVTGWCVMALQSARMADIKVPDEVFDRITMYLDKVGQRSGTRYPYQRNEQPTEVMTAEAILCRQYLGWKQNDPRMEDALDYVLRRPINFQKKRDVYYWYYATQAMHHKEGRWWKQWNEVMRQELPKQQIKAGKEAGSWDPMRPTYDEWQTHGGRLYVTCLSTYMLEVYYRHLPIYANLFDKDGLPIPYEGTEELSVTLPSAETPSAETPPKDPTKPAEKFAEKPAAETQDEEE